MEPQTISGIAMVNGSTYLLIQSFKQRQESVKPTTESVNNEFYILNKLFGCTVHIIIN